MIGDGRLTNAGRPTRRRLLAAVGSIAVGLAGCTSGETVDGDVVDDPEVFALPFPHNTDDVGLNPLTSDYLRSLEGLFFESLVVRTPNGAGAPTDPIETVETDGTTATVTYDDSHSWWNGEPVTARDRWVDERLRSFVDAADVELGREGLVRDADGPGSGAGGVPLGDRDGAVQSVSLLDDDTIRYEFDAPMAETLALDRVLDRPHNVAAWRFEPRLEELRDATTDGAIEERIRELGRDRIPLTDALEDGYGCGPYELAEVSSNRVVLDRVSDHPRADELSVPRIWLPVGRTHQARGMLADGTLDGGHGSLDGWAVEPHEQYEQLASFRSGGGYKLVCNWQDPHLARPWVRRAIAAVLPVSDVARNAGWGDPVALQCGMTAPPMQRWLDDDLRSSLYHYPVDRDDELASTFMRRGGYERRDDAWTDASGDRVSLSLAGPVWPAWSSVVDLVDTVLDDFGFEIDSVRSQGPTFVSEVEAGAFDLAPWPTVGRPNRVYDLPAETVATLGYGVDGHEQSTPLGKPSEGVVPATPGDLPDAGEGRPVDLLGEWERIRSPGTSAVTAEAVATMATWWNAAVPDVDLTSARTGVWGNVEDFAWPESGNDRYRRLGSAGRPDLQLLNDGAVVPVSGEDD